MGGNGDSRIGQIADALKLVGKGSAISMAQSFLLPKVMAVFAEHDHEELRMYIRSNYPLVERETPDGVKRALNNLGNDPRFRDQYESLVLQTVTPANVMEWLRTPEEWLDREDAEQQRAELRRCAEVIETTPGGQEWLEAQVLQLYAYAGIIPEDSTQPSTHSQAETGD